MIDPVLESLYDLEADCRSDSPEAVALRAQIFARVRPSDAGTNSLRAVLVGITVGELRWRQDRWTVLAHEGCGTAGCVAGWLSMAAGGVPAHALLGASVMVRDHLTTVREHAAEVLGLSGGDDLAGYVLSYLFAAENTLRKLWEIAEQITEGAIRCPDDLSPLVAVRDREVRDRLIEEMQ